MSVPNEVSPSQLTALAKEAGKPIRYWQASNRRINLLWALPEGGCRTDDDALSPSHNFAPRGDPRFINYWHAWAHLRRINK